MPLSERAIDILHDARRHSYGTGLVFRSPRAKPLSDMTLSKLIKELGIDTVPHGFRSSFRDCVRGSRSVPMLGKRAVRDGRTLRNEPGRTKATRPIPRPSSNSSVPEETEAPGDTRKRGERIHDALCDLQLAIDGAAAQLARSE